MRDDKDKSALYLAECRRMGIKVLPPDVNESDAELHAAGHRHPVRAVRDPQRRRQRRRLDGRDPRGEGRFTDFYDFLKKVDPVVCNKKIIESLIKAGAFDSLGHPRRGLLNVHAEAIDSFMATKRNEAHGQFDLFGGDGDDARTTDSLEVIPPVPIGEWDKSVLLRSSGRCSASTSPTTRCTGSSTCWPRPPTAPSPRSPARTTGPDGSHVTIGGLVSGLQRKVTKKGDVWAIATIEDLEGAIEVMFFPQTYNLVATSLAEDADRGGQGPAWTGATTCPS